MGDCFYDRNLVAVLVDIPAQHRRNVPEVSARVQWMAPMKFPHSDWDKWLCSKYYKNNKQAISAINSVLAAFPGAYIARVIDYTDWAMAVLGTRKRAKDPFSDSEPIWTEPEVARYTGWPAVLAAKAARASVTVKRRAAVLPDEASSTDTRCQLPLGIRGREYPQMLPRSADPR